MNYKINSSGIHDITSFNLLSNKATIFSSLNVNGSDITSAISGISTTSNTIINNLNSLSANSTLSINNLNATSTTLFNKLNSLSAYSTLLLFNHSTSITNLNASTTTLFNNLNSLSTYSALNISNIQVTSSTTFTNLNNLSSNTTLNLNNLSTNSILSISNLNATSTTIFNNLNNLSTNSTLSISNLNATSTTTFNTIYNFFTDTSILHSAIRLSDLTNSISNIQATSTTLLTYINNLTNPSTLNANSLNVSGTTKLNNATTCISSLNISGVSIFNSASTHVSSLNVSGTATLLNNLTVYNGNTSYGYAGLVGGGTIQPGYISFHKPGGTRVGYIGWSDVTNYLNLYTENDYLGYYMTGGLIVNSNITCNSTISNGASSYIYAGGLRLGGWDGNTLYNGSNPIGITALNKINFNTGTSLANYTTRMTIDTSGNVGIGTTTPTTKLDIYGTTPKLTVRGSSEGDTATLYLGTPFTTSSAYKCALIAQGLSTYSRSKLHICLNNTNDNSSAYNASINDSCATFNYNGNVGIGNLNPLDDGGATTYFCVGDSSMAYSEGAIVIGKKNGIGGTRQYKFGITTDFYWGIGDFGHSNTIPTTSWSTQLICHYVAPTNSILIDSIGRVYGNFITTSDERIKTDIQTIDNALDKVLLLRGVNYTLITENTREIGLIAQEVEHIIPEAVKQNDLNDLKGINYSGLVGLLVEAIKELNNKVSNLENILKNNNLN